MPDAPNKSANRTIQQILALVEHLSLNEKQELLNRLQQEMSVPDKTTRIKKANQPLQKPKKQPGLLKMEEDPAPYSTKPGKKNKEDAVTIPDWQKREVLNRIKKYKAHPELLIGEKTAAKIIMKM